MRGYWMPWTVILRTVEGNQLGAAWNWDRNQSGTLAKCIRNKRGPGALFWKNSTKGHRGNRLLVVIWFPIKAQQWRIALHKYKNCLQTQNDIILNMQITIKRLIWLISTPATKHQTGKICPMCSQCSRFVKAATEWAWFVMLMQTLALANGYYLMYNYNNKISGMSSTHCCRHPATSLFNWVTQEWEELSFQSLVFLWMRKCCPVLTKLSTLHHLCWRTTVCQLNQKSERPACPSSPDGKIHKL